MDNKKTKFIEEYWLKQLDGELLGVSLPLVKGEQYAHEVHPQLEISGEIYTKLKKIARGSDVALFILFLSALNVVIHKYTGAEDLVVGTIPPKDRGLKEEIVLCRNRITGDLTFKEFVTHVKEVVLKAFNHAEYSFKDIYNKLCINKGVESFDIFNIAFIYDKFQDRGRFPLAFDLLIVLSELGDQGVMEVEYNTQLYSGEIVNRFLRHIIAIFDDISGNLEMKITEIEMLTSQERKQVLYEFNDTRVEYPADKALHGLFEEQAKQGPDGIAVVDEERRAESLEQLQITYHELNRKSNQLACLLREKGVKPDTIVGLMVERSVEMVVGVLGILKAGGAYLPIDPDYPEERKRYMLADSNAKVLLAAPAAQVTLEVKEKEEPVEIIDISLDFSSLTSTLTLTSILSKVSSSNLAYILYTSGSTGRPKAVMVEHRSVVRLVKNTNFLDFNEEHRVLQTGALEFDASTLEIWGPLLNGSQLFLVNKNTILFPERLRETMKKYHITTMWMTSPLFNQLEQADIEIFAGLRYLLVGGDVLNPVHINRVREKFSHLHVINGYGPTENTTFSATFLIDKEYRDNIPIGSPISNSTAYIVDHRMYLVPIGIPGELVVGGDGISRGYLNRPDLTAEKFIKSSLNTQHLTLNTRFYRTGDLARWLLDGNIEFLGRIDQQVKIRGFRIELGEIESRLTAHGDVGEAVVRVISTTGVEKIQTPGEKDKRLCAYIVPVNGVSLDIPGLREYLSSELPDYMIPSFFVQLEKIPLTPNGKVDRKALSVPEVEAGEKYTAPRDEIEEKLVELWAEILMLDKTVIGIDDNFFHLGGHSLKATVLMTKIHNQFNVRIELTEIFVNPFIRGLARWIKNAKKEKYISLEPVEERGYYLLSSAQLRLWVICQIEEVSSAYNVPYAYIVSGKLDIEVYRRAVQALVDRHEVLRTVFIRMDGEPMQKIIQNFKYEVEEIDLRHLDAKSREQKTMEIYMTSVNKTFDLENGPLMLFRFVRLEEERYLVVYNFHHIICDGWSVDIIREELFSLYTAFLKNERIPLEPLNYQYKDYSQWQNGSIFRQQIREQEAFWLSEFEEDQIQPLNLPLDYSRPEIQSFEGSTLGFEISAEEATRLRELGDGSGITLFMKLLTIFNIFLSKVTGQEEITIGTAVAGRRHGDLQNIVGMFVNMMALKNAVSEDETFNRFLTKVKKKTLQAYENQDYQIEELIEKVVTNRDTSRNPLFDVVFALQNLEKEEKRIPGLIMEPYWHERTIPKFDLVFVGKELEDTILFSIEYCTKLFKKETIAKFIEYFKKIVSEVLKDPGRKIAEVEIISEDGKHKVLYDFNRTKTQYPGEKNLHQLFEEQVEKRPEKIALVGSTQYAVSSKNKAGEVGQLTYRELNARSNQLARFLKKKGISTDTFVAMMMDRSPEMIVGILGILKAGGAYLPIDPGYPHNRIESMLEDSNSSILLTETGGVEDHHVFTGLQGLESSDVSLQITAPRPQILDFDGLPIPDRTLIDYEKYNRYIGQGMVKHSVNLQATRGCPYNCAYCCRVWPKKNVIRSAENIYAEVKMYYEAGVRRFVFIDDIFNLNIPNSSRFFELVIKNNLKAQFLFPSGLRGDILTKDYIDLMMEAGTISFPLALETACPRLQKFIRKHLDLDKVRENLEYIMAKYPQLILELHTMHGFPTETEEEAMMTLNFIKSLERIHFPYVHILKIHPNTGMEKLALENGVSKEAIAYSRNLAYHELPDTLPFKKSFTKNYQSDFFNNYFLSKNRLLQVLPYQMRTLTEDEIVQKYNSYLPVDIHSIEELLQFLGIERSQLGVESCLDEASIAVPNLNVKLEKYFPKKRSTDGLRVLLLDLSQFFTTKSDMLYDVVEQPLGLLYLMTYINRKYGDRITGKIAKSRIDFDSYGELKALLQEFKPDVIGIRSLTYYREFFHRTIAMIRHWGFDVPIIAGGPYITVEFKSVLKDANINLAVLGEGENTFGEIIGKILENKGKLPGEEVLEKIVGIAYVPGRTGAKAGKAREIFMLDLLQEQLCKESRENLEPVNQSHHLSYSIFTSGSTGKPKGTLTTHYNVSRVVRDTNYIDLTEDDRVLQLSNYAFDGSTFDIYGALLNGGTLVMLKKEEVLSIDILSGLIKRENISVFFVTTAMFNALVDVNIGCLDSVRSVLFGGERVSVNHTRRALEHLGPGKIIHVYGPTETTVYATYYRVDQLDEALGTVPIGKPISNTTIYILDKYMKPVPLGIAGEIYIGGDGTARGYLNNPELTAEMFIKFPYSPTHPLTHSPIYRTGDLARWLPEGDIEFIGRIDQQVKIRGFRIEMGEIEHQLLSQPGIKEAVVTVKPIAGVQDKQLCAYIIPEREVEVSELKGYLSRQLPDYMIPTFIVPVKKIPLTPNGKVDWKALPAPKVAAGSIYTAHRDEIEEKLVEIWAEVLFGSGNLDEAPLIGIDDNFFELGGHSLKVTAVVAEIHKKLDVEVPLTEFFKRPNIRELSQYIKESVKEELIPIEPTEGCEYYELSSAQKRLYIIQQMDRQSINYNIPAVYVLEGSVDRARLEDTCRGLIQRHGSFKTSFAVVNDELVQQVHEVVEFKIEYFSVERRTESAEQRELNAEIIKDFIRPFDLSQAPLVRVGLIKTGENKHILMLDMHHIIADGTSMGIFTAEFMQLYRDEQLPALKLQYKDYSQWQNSHVVKESIKKQEEFWLKRFESEEQPVLNLPLDYKRPEIQSFEGSTLSFEIDGEVVEVLKELGKEESITLFMKLLAIFNVLLTKIGDNEEIIMGTPVAGRRHPDLKNMIGMFVNTLSIKNIAARGETFEKFLREVKENTLQAFENQDYPFEELVDQVVMTRDTSRNPLFDVMFGLQNMEYRAMEIPGMNLKPYEYESVISKFDLSLYGYEAEDRILFTFEYCTRLFKEDTITRFAGYFKRILSDLVMDPGKRIFEIEIISGDEKKQLLDVFNNTTAEYPQDKTIHRLFAEQVEKSPEKIALVGPALRGGPGTVSQHLTYRELNQKVQQLACLLRQKGIEPGSIAAIMVERSLEMIIGILGILKAGGAYLPIDPDYPPDRIDFILRDSNAGVLVSELSKVSEVSKGIEVIDLSSLIAANEGTEPTHLTPLTLPTHLCYIIYTSGSTGQPKGVMVDHQSVINLLFYLNNEYPLGERDSYLLKTSYIFDVSVTELFGWFLEGGRLAILPRDHEKDPHKILHAICHHRITHINFVPSMFNAFEESLQMDSKSVEFFSSLKYIFLAGEALKGELINRFKCHNTGVLLENLYGPTEATVYASKYSLSHWDGYSDISIGKPVQNGRLYILDRFDRLQPIGVSGELCIAGVGLARGYLNRPELTAEHFIHLTLNTQHLTLYKTGDLARWLADGNIEFLGRIDQQVKIRGFRIELEEIERQLLNHAEVTEAVVVAREKENGDRYLCAYIVNREGGESRTTAGMAVELKQYLSRSLPDYMVPSFFVELEKIPLTTSGKINRKVLPVPEIEISQGYIRPRNELEEQLVEIWAEVLGVKSTSIGIDDNFFELGGHSLRATVLMIKIHSHFDVRLELTEIFKAPYIRALAKRIKSSKKEKYISLETVEEKEYYPLSYAQRRLWILCQFEEDSSAYNMPVAYFLSGKLDIGAYRKAVQALVDRHESLRTVFIVVDGKPKQRITRNFEYEVEVIDLRHFDEESRGQKAKEIFAVGANNVFQLEHGPLFLFQFVRLEDEKYLFVNNIHHIVCDGWSLGIITNEIFTLYNAFLKNENKTLEPLQCQYKDYSYWHSALIEGERFNRDEKYWLEKFRDKPNGIELPLDHPRKAVQTFNGGRVSFIIDEERKKQLHQLGMENEVTFFMTFLTVFMMFLFKYGGQKDIIIGSPIAGRKLTELDGMIGFLVNTIVFREIINPDENFAQLAKKIKNETLQCYEHQDYPFDLLVDKLGLERDLSQSPIFNVMLAHNNADTINLNIGMEGMSVSNYTHADDFNMSKFDLIFFMDDRAFEVEIKIEYNSDLFERRTIERMSRNFLALVDDLLSNPETPIYELKYIDEAGYEKVVGIFNDNAVQFSDLNLQELFERRVEQSGNRTAVVCHDQVITYGELNKQANQLANYLREKYNIKPNDIIGIAVDRSIKMITALLGIIKSGAGYVAIDPNYPEERLQLMLDDSRAQLLIIDEMRPELFGDYKGKMINIYTDWQEIGRHTTHNPPAVHQPSDVLYVIYTSGSTGTPNGAMLSHGILTNLVQWQHKKTDIDASLRCLQFTSINFCVSFQEIIITLTAGGEVHLIGDIQRQDIDYLMEFLVSHRIEVLYLPFSYLNFLFNESGRCGQSFKHHLKHIITAGEQLKISAGLKKFLEANPRLKLHNHYGSSEMHVVTSYTLDASTVDRVPIPPAGKPISNTRIYILDDYEKPVPIGVWGELFVSGSSEVLGYIHNSRLTDKKLLNHPNLSDDGKRLYRSGDLGRWLEDGNIELKGRKDDQVKVRGFRVEPGEIESKILSIDTVRECVVVVKTDERGNKYLVAYVVFDHEKMNLLEIKKLLNKELPQHMIPHLMVLESLPLMPNGKVDRERLPEPVLEKQGEYVGPRNKMEKQLVEIWSQALGIEEEVIGIDDNFFDLGGHSLKATTVVSEILKKLNVKVPLTEMFKGATIRELSAYIRGSVKEIFRPLEPEEKKEYYPLSSAQKRFYILHQLEPNSTSYNMPTILIVEGGLYRERMESIFNQLIRRHEAYRTSFQLIENNPVQRIYNYEAIEFEIEYEEVPENEVKPLLEHFIRSFDLSFPPLLRVKFVKLENKKHLMMVDMHHILSDAVSMQLLVNDFVAFYKEETVPPLKLHYKDYSQWQNEKIISGEMKRQEEYWLKKFEENIPVLDIPTDFVRPEVKRFEGAITGFEINGADAKVLRGYAKKEEATMFMVGLTLFNILLFKLTNQEDIVVGTITEGRQYPDLRHIIGIFINSLALRNYPGGDKTFVEFLREVRQCTLEAFDNQDYQFEDLVEKVMKNRDAARNPIFDVLFSFSEKGNTGSRQPYPGDVEKKEQEKEVEFNVRPYREWEGKEAKFDILLSGFETEEIVYFAVEYSTSLFKQETIERFGKYFQEIVSEVVKNGTIKLRDIGVSTRFGTEASDAFRDDESDFGF